MSAGELIREARLRHRLSQRTLALRAGTRQAAISRIERGEVSPSVDTLRQLMLAMGEELVLGSRRLPGDWDPVHMQSMLTRTADERAALAFSWNRLAGRLHEAGRQAGAHRA